MTADLEAILADYRGYPWFAEAGNALTDVLVAEDLSDAWDGYWDGWNARSHAHWSAASHRLEAEAQRVLGDEEIDRIFAVVSSDVAGPIWEGIGTYLDRIADSHPDPSGIYAAIAIDLLDAIKSDLSWAAVETIMGQPGFFSDLLRWYRRGRRLCGWMGGLPPTGVPVVL
jgi:hypothetical protein